MADPRGLETECPVCFEYMLPPIYQCSNRHPLCANCINEIRRCPMCRQEMPKKKIRNLEAERASLAQEFFCPYERNGCRDKIRHEHFNCAFAEKNFCVYLGINCETETSRERILAHLKEAHGISGTTVALGETIEILQTFPTSPTDDIANRNKFQWKPHYFVQGETVFFLTTTHNSGGISWGVYMLGSAEAASKYTSRIKLFSMKDKQNLFLRWGNPVQSLINDQAQSESLFALNMEQLKMFWHETKPGEKSWLLQFRISKKRDPTPSTNAVRQLQRIQSQGHCPVTISVPEVAEERPTARNVRRNRLGRGIQQNEIHEEGISCHCCETEPIVGPLYKCVECDNVDLCSTCAEADSHNSGHIFIMCFTRTQKRDFQKLFSNLNRLTKAQGNFERGDNGAGAHEAVCDSCGADPLIGPRHMCAICDDYDLCQRCVNDNVHNHHIFLIVYSPEGLRKLDTVLESLF